MSSKQLMIISGPTSKINDMLSLTGFVRDFVHQSTYRMELDSPAGVYVYQIPYEELNGTITLFGETSFFEGTSDSEVPEVIQAAALDRWHALRIRIRNGGSPVYSPDLGDRRPSIPIPSRSVETARNGSMVQDFADMQRLGYDMERMKTEQQLNDEGLVNDPIQYVRH